MENITAICVHASYGLAVLLLVAVAGSRYLKRREHAAASPPDFPVGKVATWFYGAADLWGYGILVTLFYLLAIGGTMVPPSERDAPLSIENILLTMGLQIFMAGIVAAFVIQRRNLKDWLGLGWKNWPLVFAIAPATVLSMWALFAGLYELGYMDLMEKLGVEKVQDAVKIFQEEQNPVLLVLMAVAAVIVAPVCEEVVFRGYLYPVAKKFSGPWVAAISTALIFSAAHGSLAALLPLFVFGLVLVALYEITGSIWAPMAVHMLFNGATVAVQMIVRYSDLPITVSR
ncbi:MAG: CPBP family intramembrane metalloprotease [Armatimonadetes bacterium]|nr:CPBP family intramembrane metalloprotease [Akkermansiaceae bacterium]